MSFRFMEEVYHVALDMMPGCIYNGHMMVEGMETDGKEDRNLYPIAFRLRRNVDAPGMTQVGDKLRVVEHDHTINIRTVSRVFSRTDRTNSVGHQSTHVRVRVS